MKATMKQIVAASSVGIIRVPNQPTYRRLSVEVTHSQKESQAELVERWEIEEEAISHSKYMCKVRISDREPLTRNVAYTCIIPFCYGM